MMTFLCSPAGKKPTQSDLDQVEAFRRMLGRSIGHPAQIEMFFNGDQHLDAPALANRSDYRIIDGQIEVAR
jgi:hypothetical protein